MNIMNSKLITTSIEAHKARLRYEEQRAVTAITEQHYAIAVMALSDAAKLKGAIEELEFILDSMEAGGQA